MKKLISVLLLVSLSFNLFSKSKKETYLIATISLKSEQSDEQILISTRQNKHLSGSPTILLHILSPDKGIRESFIHANYSKTDCNGRPPMDIKMISVSVLKKAKVIDLNEYLKKADKKKFRNFCLKLRNNTIYLIDRNDIKNDSIKAIEVEYIRHLQY